MASAQEAQRQICGVIMPISAIDGCDERHWIDVKEVIFKAVIDAEMNPQLVSDDIEIGIIHKRIVQNIYDNPVVVCDISARNPNVMLELGMRLAFDKPVIVVKDDKTNYSFDSSPIEHVTYPRDLHYQSILTFQATLRDKIAAMLKGKNEHSFLKSFGAFKTSKLEHVEGTPLDFILDELRVIKSALRRTETETSPSPSENIFPLTVRIESGTGPEANIIVFLSGTEQAKMRLHHSVRTMKGVLDVRRVRGEDNEETFRVRTMPDAERLVQKLIHDSVKRLGGLSF